MKFARIFAIFAIFACLLTTTKANVYFPLMRSAQVAREACLNNSKAILNYCALTVYSPVMSGRRALSSGTASIQGVSDSCAKLRRDCEVKCK